MSAGSEFTPSGFQAMFRPRKEDVQEEGPARDFTRITGAEPTVREETPSFVALARTIGPAGLARDDENGITVIFHGEIYPAMADTAAYILEQYRSHGLGFVRDLNGCFAFLLIDRPHDAVYAVTDRLNTRRVFFSKYEESFWFSSSLRLHPVSGVPLDPIGIACYLANGVVLNSRTIYDGVRVLERASIYTLKTDGAAQQSYWSHVFTREYASKDPKDLRKELSVIVSDAIKNRTEPAARYSIALSGGYDSATILAVLVKQAGISDVDCYSYNYGPLKPGSDAYIAGQMAGYLGCPHRVVQSYSGDLASAICLNAKLGHTMAKYCEDAEVWMELRDQLAAPNGASVLFTGDECFGDVPFLRFSEIKSMEDVLECVGIHDFSRLSWLSRMLPKKKYLALRDGWNEERRSLLKRSPPYEDYRDYKDFFYLDQRINHVICTWRHFIMGEHARIRQPLLDRAIVDFVSRITPEMRLWKRLYVDTVTEMFPDLFKIGICRIPGAYPDWTKEFAEQSDAIRKLASVESRLDEIIPPRAIDYLLWMNQLAVRHRGMLLFAKKIGRRLNKRLELDYERISNANLLQRLLVLKLTVAEDDARNRTI